VLVEGATRDGFWLRQYNGPYSVSFTTCIVDGIAIGARWQPSGTRPEPDGEEAGLSSR
jgi:hypothetical protein